MGICKSLRKKIALKIYPEFKQEFKRLRKKLEDAKDEAGKLAASRDYYKGLIDKDPNYARLDELTDFDRFDEFMRDPNKKLIFD